MPEALELRRARSVAGPLRRAHPASGATWNVQVVRGKMSSTCLWHACRALMAGLLLMLLGGAMATIGYYAETLSVLQEVRGNATVSVKDEARGFHLSNLSYAGPIVMGFGGFIVVAACVMTFEARDSAAKVTPARPAASLPRPAAPRRSRPARLDTLGVYRLPHAMPLPRALPLVMPPRRERRREAGARCGSAPDLRGGGRAPPPHALRRPLRRYALSVDEPPPSALSASAAESECGSQSSLALDLHAGAGATLRVRDNTRDSTRDRDNTRDRDARADSTRDRDARADSTRDSRRRPLARQQRLRDDSPLQAASGSTSRSNVNNSEEIKMNEAQQEVEETVKLLVEDDTMECAGGYETVPLSDALEGKSPSLVVSPTHSDICVVMEEPEPDPPETSQ